MPAKSSNPYARILPFPVGPVLLSEAMVTAEGRIYRAALAICFAYWLSGCRPIPTDPTALGMLARLPQSHMTALKPALDAVLSELLPMLAAEYATRRESATMRKRIAQIANAESVRVRRAAKRNANDLPAPSGPTPPQARIQPVKAPPWDGGTQTDMRAYREVKARVAASQRRASDRGSTSGLLSDGSTRTGR
jgi:hypothetical protein